MFMEQFKRAQVIMLPTENRETSIIMLGVVPNYSVLTKTILEDKEDWMRFGKPQHLYILSDDEIKEGDWYLDNIPEYYTIQQAKNDWCLTKDHKKIIATTDTSLMYEKNLGYLTINPNTLDEYRVLQTETIKLPQPSQQFIGKYIESYNKGEVITDVLVEYEVDKYDIRNQYQDCPSGKYWEDEPNPQSPDILYSNARYYTPNVNTKDNTIIMRVKDSWSREEVIELLYKFNKMGIRPIDNFIEENL